MCTLKQNQVQIHTRSAKIKKAKNIKCWGGCGVTEFTLLVEMKNDKITLEISWVGVYIFSLRFVDI